MVVGGGWLRLGWLVVGVGWSWLVVVGGGWLWLVVAGGGWLVGGRWWLGLVWSGLGMGQPQGRRHWHGPGLGQVWSGLGSVPALGQLWVWSGLGFGMGQLWASSGPTPVHNSPNELCTAHDLTGYPLPTPDHSCTQFTQ